MDVLSLALFMGSIAFLLGVLVFASKYLDKETFAMVRAKILALEMWAEFEITGNKRGDERMNSIEDIVKKNFNPEELSFLDKKGGIRKFAESVLPIARTMFVWLLKTGKGK